MSKIENFKEELIELLKKYDDNNFVNKILEKVNNNDLEENFNEFDNIFHYTIELNTPKHSINPNDIYIEIKGNNDKIKVVSKLYNSIGNITKVTKIIRLDTPIKQDSLIAIRDDNKITLQARYINSDKNDDNEIKEEEIVKQYDN